MSDLENPYQIPESPAAPEKPQSSGVSLSETTMRYLRETSPWLRFIGVLGFIGCGLMIFGGIITTVVMSMFSDFTAGFGRFPPWFFLFIYIPLGVLCFFPSLFIYNFGKKLRDYQLSNSGEDLELAFKNNKSYWKFVGILSIISLATLPFSIVIAIIGGFMSVIMGL
jgi:hypothetical protein